MTAASTGSNATASLDRPTLQPGAERPDVEHSDRPMPVIPIDAAGLALRKAWAAYLLFGLIPPTAMIGAIFWLIFTGDTPLQSPEIAGFWGMIWLIAGLTWVGLSLPIAFWIRRNLWHRFYEGGVVEPTNYFKGWLVVWTPLVIGGVLGFIGLALTREVGTIFISLLAFVVFLAMTPNGHALTRPVGDHDDPGVYEEPK